MEGVSCFWGKDSVLQMQLSLIELFVLFILNHPMGLGGEKIQMELATAFNPPWNLVQLEYICNHYKMRRLCLSLL